MFGDGGLNQFQALRRERQLGTIRGGAGTDTRWHLELYRDG